MTNISTQHLSPRQLAELLTQPAKPSAKSDATPTVVLVGAELLAAERIADAIAARKLADAEHSQAKSDLEPVLEAMRAELSRRQGRYIPTVAVVLGDGARLKYCRKQQGTPPRTASEADALANILGENNDRYVVAATSYKLNDAVLDNAELFSDILARLGPDLFGLVFQRSTSYALTPAFWSESTLDDNAAMLAEQAQAAGLVKPRAGEFSIG